MRPIDFFLRGLARYPDAIAVEGDRNLTYGALAEEVKALAAALQALDPEPGSRVAIIAYNSVDHVVAWLATFMAGKIWVPSLPTNGAAEAQRIVDFAEATIVLADAEGMALLDGFAGGRSYLLGNTGAGTTGALRDASEGRAPAEHSQGRDATCAIKFTGGTTGMPKGVMQPERAWAAFTAMLVHHLGFAAGERTIVATPMTHGISCLLLPTLATGGTLVMRDRLRPAALVEVLAQRGTRTFAPPTLINAMASDRGCDADRFPALRQILYSAAPMADPDIVAAQRAFGPRIMTAYGQTEAPLMVTVLSTEEMTDPALRGSVGRDALLTRTAILDSDGNALPDGEIGEIGVISDLVMTGYWRQPEKSHEAFAGPWLRTGDLGVRDRQGYVTIRGRAREMINTGGFKVFPGDVETVLRTHPAIADCAVFGRPDSKWGETVCAAVVLRSGAAAGGEELSAHVRTVMGPVRAPKTVEFVDAVPRNALGKVQRHKLAEGATHG